MSDLNRQLARIRDHIVALAPTVAESLGLYQRAEDLTAERSEVEAELLGLDQRVDLPAVGDLRRRIAAEFDRLGEVMASGTIEERRDLISCYVREIKADPDQGVVHIGLYPTVWSQRIAGEVFDLSVAVLTVKLSYRTA